MNSTPTPTALVPLALILLLWNTALGVDYILDHFQIGSPEWPGIARLLPLEATWVKVVWAMAVWLGFGASFFLLIRDNASVLLYFATTCCAIAVAVGVCLAIGVTMSTPQYVLLGALILLPLVGWIFSRTFNQNGALK